MPAPPLVHQLVPEHVAAFNAHDTERVLAGLAEDAVWITGRDRFQGRAELAEVFDDWLWSMNPSLEIRSLVAGDGAAAAELTERLTVDGDQRRYPIAVFFRFAGELITHGTVYREGNADL